MGGGIGAVAAAAAAAGAEPGARIVPLGPPLPAAAVAVGGAVGGAAGAVITAPPPPPPARKGLSSLSGWRKKTNKQAAAAAAASHHHPHFHHQQHFASNAIKTAKYNALTFLPRFLFEMFSRAAYLYFLLQAVLSWIPVVSPFGGWGSTLALLFVLAVAAVKALFEDVKRHQQDRATNASRARVVVRVRGSSSEAGATAATADEVETKDVEWRDLRVGDVVRVDDGELFPADLVCLHSALEDDVCFIKTTNLDGENNLKIRRPVDVSDAFPSKSSSSTSSSSGLFVNKNEQQPSFQLPLHTYLSDCSDAKMSWSPERSFLTGAGGGGGGEAPPSARAATERRCKFFFFRVLIGFGSCVFSAFRGFSSLVGSA